MAARLTHAQTADLERLRWLLTEDIDRAVSRIEVVRLQQRWEIVDRVLLAEGQKAA